MLILYFKHKKQIILLNLVLSIFFVGHLNANEIIYSNNTPKDVYVLDPIAFQYNYGSDKVDGVGGADVVLSDKFVLEPKESLKLVEEDKKTISDVPIKDRIGYYIVQKGDNIQKIAKKFKISQNTIIWENKLNSRGLLKIGQKLTILPITGIRYIVKSGDSLLTIAKKTKSDISKIKEINELNNNKIKVGQVLLIPDGKKIVVKKSISRKKKSVKKARSHSVKVSKNIKVSKSPLSKLFIKPTTGRFTSGFGYRRLFHRMHYGVDFANKRGTSIVSAASGTVVKVYSGCRVGNMHCGGGFGNNILIQHDNGYQTRYAHLHTVKVRAGQRVVAGQIIATMGNTGHVSPRPRNYKSTAGTHLHFEILKNGRRISPNFMRYK